MTDLETVELALGRARSRAIQERVQDQSVILAFDLLIGELQRIHQDRHDQTVYGAAIDR